MIEVEMSKDIREVEPKLFGPFTRRQTLCVVGALAYGIPLFFVMKSIPIFARILIVIILMAPVIACGWCDMYGLHLEQFALHLYRTCIQTPRKRKNDSYNFYEEIYRNEIEEPQNQEKKRKRNIKDGRIK